MTKQMVAICNFAKAPQNLYPARNGTPALQPAAQNAFRLASRIAGGSIRQFV